MKTNYIFKSFFFLFNYAANTISVLFMKATTFPKTFNQGLLSKWAKAMALKPSLPVQLITTETLRVNVGVEGHTGWPHTLKVWHWPSHVTAEGWRFWKEKTPMIYNSAFCQMCNGCRWNLSDRISVTAFMDTVRHKHKIDWKVRATETLCSRFVTLMCSRLHQHQKCQRTSEWWNSRAAAEKESGKCH